MMPDRICPQCGQVVPWGRQSCPICSTQRGHLWSLRPEAYLAILSVLIIGLFVITSLVVRLYRDSQRGLAQFALTRGEQDLRAGHTSVALADFRTAFSYSGGDARYQLRLAQALAAAAQEQSESAPAPFLLVESAGGRWHGISREELRQRAAHFPPDARLEQLLGEAPLPHLHPDQPLEEGMCRLGQWPLLPVVSRVDLSKLEGVLSLPDALVAYGIDDFRLTEDD